MPVPRPPSRSSERRARESRARARPPRARREDELEVDAAQLVERPIVAALHVDASDGVGRHVQFVGHSNDVPRNASRARPQTRRSRPLVLGVGDLDGLQDAFQLIEALVDVAAAEQVFCRAASRPRASPARAPCAASRKITAASFERPAFARASPRCFKSSRRSSGSSVTSSSTVSIVGGGAIEDARAPPRRERRRASHSPRRARARRLRASG